MELEQFETLMVVEQMAHLGVNLKDQSEVVQVDLLEEVVNLNPVPALVGAAILALVEAVNLNPVPALVGAAILALVEAVNLNPVPALELEVQEVFQNLKAKEEVAAQESMKSQPLTFTIFQYLLKSSILLLLFFFYF